MGEFLMPILGADMEAGTLVAWRKQPGDHVERGDIIAEVETDKADVEVEIFMTGVLEKILVEPGDKVPVGTPLALIREDASAIPAASAPGPVPAVRAPAPTGDGHRVRISPAARQLAAQLGVDFASVKGSGPDGRIMLRDIDSAAKRVRSTPPPTPAAAPRAPAAPPTPATPPPTTPQPAADDRVGRMRQAIAAAMSRSAREIPHFHIATTIDMEVAMRWLTEENTRRPIAERLLYGVLLMKAVALALHDVPELNAVWAGDHVELRPAIHVGMAISLRGGGLVAPAIHDTDKRSLGELMWQFRDLVQRARSGSLRSSEMSDPTVTITSLGERGAEAVYGLIFPPQVALVGFGRLTERAVSIDGGIFSRRTITATLSADHRVCDGHRGSVFLAALERILQEPSKL